MDFQNYVFTFLNHSFPAPRPVIIVTDVQSRQVLLHVTDPTPADTLQYMVRYKTDTGHSPWLINKRNKTSPGGDARITLYGVHPYTSYTVEVASYYKDGDVGPYSVNKHFKTKQAGKMAAFCPLCKHVLLTCWLYCGRAKLTNEEKCQVEFTQLTLYLQKQVP